MCIRDSKCSLCDYASSRAGHLRTHMKTHTGEKSNKCNQCDYAASQGVHLMTHMRTHTGEKLNKCSLCNYANRAPVNWAPDSWAPDSRAPDSWAPDRSTIHEPKNSPKCLAQIISRMLNCTNILDNVPSSLRARQGPKTTIKLDNSPKCLAKKSG